MVVEGVGALSEVLNLRNLKSDLPPEFVDIYDQETYAKSQEYTRVRTRFGFWSTAYDLVILLAFWLAGGFGWLDGVVSGLGAGPIITGLLFFIILLVARGVLDLPFDLYGTFVIEERFGFNRTTRKTFISDLARGMAVSAVLGLPLLAAFLAVFQYLGSYAWLVAWVGAALVSFALQIIFPTFVLPLFNKFTPLEDGELRSAIMELGDKTRFPLEQVYVVDASRRSTKGNAYFTGFGKTKRIALFDTLVERHPVKELVAVLAHEIGHYKRRHVLTSTVLGIIEMGVFLWLFSLLADQPGLFQAFGVSTPSFYVGILAVGILLRLPQMVLSIGMAAFSRHNERQADDFAVVSTGNGEPLADGLARLSKDSLSNLTPHPFYVVLNYSHPPVLERIRRLRRADHPIQ